jgi:prepilin-type N-terminal cleavage/methylation domain-containing protein
MHLKTGFTLLEVIIVVGIMCLLLAIASLNLMNIVPDSSLDGTVQVMVANIKQQQMKAMTGEITSGGTSDNYGVYLSGTTYTLFHGNVYVPGASDNYAVGSDDVNITTSFPASSLIFKKSSGEIVGFQADKNTITVTQVNYGLRKIITIDKYGAIESIL